MKNSLNKNILIVVPVYNCRNTILNLYEKLKEQGTVSILFVNDGSTDETEKVLKENNLTYITHHKNLGKGRSIQTGFEYAIDSQFDYVLTIDADLQHPPEHIPEFVKHSNKNCVIVGWRNDYSKMPFHRIFSNTATSFLLSIRTGKPIKDSQCGYRLYPTKVIDELSFVETGFQFESEILIKCVLSGYKIHHIPIPTIYKGEKSAMRNITDTIKFVAMYFRSFFW